MLIYVRGTNKAMRYVQSVRHALQASFAAEELEDTIKVFKLMHRTPSLNERHSSTRKPHELVLLVIIIK